MPEYKLLDEDTIKRNLDRKIEVYITERRQEIEREPHKYPLSSGIRRRYKNFSDNEILMHGKVCWYTAVEATEASGIKGTYPTRSQLILLAQHLQCSQVQTAEFLAIGGYLPDELPYNKTDADNGVLIRQNVVQLLPGPAYLLSAEWDIIDWNPQLIRIFGLEDLESHLIGLKKEDPHNLNLMRLIFDKGFPVRKMIEDAENWKDMATRNVHGFILDNLLQTQQPWYQETLVNFNKLEGFEDIYKKAMTTDLRYGDRMEYVTRFKVNLLLSNRHSTSRSQDSAKRQEHTIAVRSNFVRLGNSNYPQITLFLPSDTRTTSVFHQMFHSNRTAAGKNEINQTS